jgi:VanZ like family
MAVGRAGRTRSARTAEAPQGGAAEQTAGTRTTGTKTAGTAGTTGTKRLTAKRLTTKRGTAKRLAAERGAEGRERAGRMRTGGLLARALTLAFALVCLGICVAVVLELTLRPSPASVGIAHTNLRPGATIRLYLDQPSVREAVLQIGGNILIGVPFGLLLPTLWPRARGLMRVVAITSLVILLVELAQHFFVEGRSFDVDDIILAAFGSAVGYLPLGRLLALWAHPRHRHWWERSRDSLLNRRPAG